MRNASLNQKPDATVMAPVTTMNEMPLLTEAEQAAMLAELKAAEEPITAGHGTAHDAQTFVAGMEAIRAKAKRAAAP